ncbi:MAG: SsrA-binding protein SmpB [Bacteroidia bacterium]|nr:SsrA-binding protein SmpB [Bacteroidia bacterium]
MAEKKKKLPVIQNKKAKFEYTFLETFQAGIALTGTEVKSLREGKANLQEAYCYINRGELFIKGMNISEYDKGSYNNHEPTRERKLLLKKREIEKLRKGLEQEGATIVPYRVFFNERNLVKVDLALGKGKKIHDKRESLKEKDSKKEMDRQMKKYI